MVIPFLLIFFSVQKFYSIFFFTTIRIMQMIGQIFHSNTHRCNAFICTKYIWLPGYCQWKSDFNYRLWIPVGLVSCSQTRWTWIYNFCWIFQKARLCWCRFIERRIIRTNKNPSIGCNFRNAGKKENPVNNNEKILQPNQNLRQSNEWSYKRK